MAGVQLVGAENILSALEKTGAEGWAIVQGRNLRVTGSSSGELQEWLSILSASQSSFTLRLYSDMEGDEGITLNTPYNASFVCSMNNGFSYPGMSGIHPNLLARLESIEKKLSEEEPDEDEINLNRIIMDYLHNPGKLATAVGAIKNLLGGGGSPLQAVGSTTPGIAAPLNDEEKLQRLSVALDKLERADKNIVVRLEKLAHIAETDPDTFALLLKKLDNY